jgi:hypothetical protein
MIKHFMVMNEKLVVHSCGMQRVFIQSMHQTITAISAWIQGFWLIIVLKSGM